MTDPIRDVIFDVDGTLVDSLPGITWSVEEALALCGLPRLTRNLRPLIGPPIRSILATVTGVCQPKQLDELEQSFRSSYDSAGWRGTLCHAGTADLLALLRGSGIDLWVVTNKPARVTVQILSELKLARFFREIACRDSRKPAFGSKAEVLVDLLERRGLQASACLMVGDTLEDCHAAAAAGVRCAIVPHGYGAGLEKSLAAAGCRLVSGWDEIAELCAADLCAVER